ncbi:hypothetical protein NC651_006603 [Populus alba x Populus x berolinensis]|nr:hypothetical protein NC651_006603 [Populus alba x Populus x berolinensis]
MRLCLLDVSSGIAFLADWVKGGMCAVFESLQYFLHKNYDRLYNFVVVFIAGRGQRGQGGLCATHANLQKKQGSRFCGVGGLNTYEMGA